MEFDLVQTCVLSKEQLQKSKCCRFCGLGGGGGKNTPSDTTAFIPIFEQSDRTKTLNQKLHVLINQYLPIEVSENEMFYPRLMCSTCFSDLEDTISFFDKITEGQKLLRIIIDSEPGAPTVKLKSDDGPSELKQEGPHDEPEKPLINFRPPERERYGKYYSNVPIEVEDEEDTKDEVVPSPDLKPKHSPGSKLELPSQVEESSSAKSDPLSSIQDDSIENCSPVILEDEEDIDVEAVVTEDIGIQTDLEEDPDVYYFAGGRHVGSQPDYDEEYGPIPPFVPGEMPVLALTLCDTDVLITIPAPTVTPDETSARPLTPKPGIALEPIETKSSATQLSVGGLVSKTEEVNNSLKTKECTSEVSSLKPSVTAPTTFAEKAKRGMLRPGSGHSVPLQVKPFLVGGVNRPIPPATLPTTLNIPGSSASSVRTTKGMSTNVNYRSNIASRCRTAAANKLTPLTSQPPSSQQGSQIPVSPTGKLNYFSPSTSSSTHAKPLPTASHNRALSIISPTSSPHVTRRTPTSSVNTSTSTAKSFSSCITSSPSSSGPKPDIYLNKPVKSPEQTTPKQQAPKRTEQAKPGLSQAPRAGVFRSKSMINPVSAMNARAKDIAKNSAAGRKHGDSKGSSASIPAQFDGMKRRALSNVGEDGWETVRARNRSRWSLSSCSSSTNDLVVAPQPLPEPKVVETETKPNDAEEGMSTSWKNDHSSVDDEEIKQNDEDLDIAIREEELIEEELLQVEKDFEAIENRTTGPSVDGSVETPPSEPDNIAISPTTLEILEDLENRPIEEETNPIVEENNAKYEAEDCFFIGITEKQPEDSPPKEHGRNIVTLLEKLMSPAKRCDSAEALRRHQAKLAKAERNRERLLEAKYDRYVELSDRFKTLSETTKKLVERRATLVARAEERRRRAVEKRQEYLKNIRMKAHDEDSKAKEIAFINYLEAQNKRYDYLASVQEVEERLITREEDRKTKLEERSAKAAGVLERQFRIRTNWQIKLGQMQERRRKAQERIMRERQERAKERSELAQEKARDREGRVSALNAAKQAKKEELKKVIQQKQQDTARRHEENMEHIRQKAFELSVPRTSEDAAVRMCTLCKVVIPSEVQELVHLRCRPHLEAVKKMEKNNLNNSGTIHVAENFGLKFIADVHLDKVEPGLQTDKNRHKTMRKHCKKIILKLNESGKEFESSIIQTDINGKHFGEQKKLKYKIQRNIREMERLIKLFQSEKGSIHLATSLDRLFSETRKVAVRNLFIQDSLVELGLFKVIQNLFDCKSPDLTSKVFIGACNLLIGAAFQNLSNTLFIIRSSCICNILEFAASRWNALVPDYNRWLCGSPVGANEPLPVDPVVEPVIELLFNVLNVVPDPFIGIRNPKQMVVNSEEVKQIESRTLDILGYVVCSGIIDRLSVYCTGVRCPVENQPQVAGLLKASLDFLTMLIYTLQQCWDQKKPDSTQLLAALESSEIAGSISMTYSLLLYQGAPTRPRSVENGNIIIPPPPGPLSASVIKSTLCLINAIAMLDSEIFQDVLGAEAVSLQFRHITSQLLWQVVPHSEKEPQWSSLISQLIIAIGNFTVQNKQNQVTIQSGQTPTVLQQLCSLPSQYFKEPKLSRHLFPTLIAATYGCPENQAILTQQNISAELLDGFMKSEFAKVNSITKRLLPSRTPTSDSHSTTPTSSVALSPSKKSKKSHGKKRKAAEN